MQLVKKIIIGVGLTLAVSIVGFYALNSYIYTEKQGEVEIFPDGVHFGFIRAMTDNGTAIDFDDAVWLTGAEGEAAAMRAQRCTPDTKDDCLPNGYFIENISRDTKRVPVGDNATVILVTWRMDETGEVRESTSTLPVFEALINNPEMHWNKLPYVITVEQNKIVRIHERYIP